MLRYILRCGILCGLTAISAVTQTRPEAKPPLSDQVFKNVQVLKGIPVDEFMATMGFISASLGETCTDCHIAESGGSWERYADDTPRKRTARRMMAMVTAIDKQYFGGQRVVTCYSCHRGGERPRVTPSLADLYGPPHPEEPDRMIKEGPDKPTVDQVLDRYLQAVGGAQRLAAVTSFTAKGTYKGFSDIDKNTYDIFAKAPNLRTTIVHTPNGDSTSIFDGHAAWTAAPATDSPVSVLELAGGDLDGARLDAELAFPAQIKQTLKQWRVAYPATIDDKDMQVLQGTIDGRYPVNLYFDSKTGLLTRLVRYADSPIGLSPTQIDYSDYRDVSGIMMPFRQTVTWLDGRALIELTEVQANAAIDASRFAKPAPSTAKK